MAFCTIQYLLLRVVWFSVESIIKIAGNLRAVRVLPHNTECVQKKYYLRNLSLLLTGNVYKKKYICRLYQHRTLRFISNKIALDHQKKVRPLRAISLLYLSALYRSYTTLRYIAPTTPHYIAPTTSRYIAPATLRYIAPSTPRYIAPTTPCYIAPITPHYMAPTTPLYITPATPRYIAPTTPRYIALHRIES